MIELANISLPLDAALAGNESLAKKAAADALGIEVSCIASIRLIKRSVDARKKQNVHFVATLGVELSPDIDEQRLLAETTYTHAKLHVPYEPLLIPFLGQSEHAKDSDAADSVSEQLRPVVVGMGPAGLFSALYLAKAGLCPLLIERGQAVEQRMVDVAAFNKGGDLLPNSNIQFGEGGAGTFSDGKLTTNTKNPYVAHVLHWFAEAGAPEEILWQAKPHIGTDHLVDIVRTMRNHIIELGGEVRFATQLTDIRFEEGELREVETTNTLTGEKNTFGVAHLILATGHSARDTFALLHDAQLALEQKPFSVGIRIEHKQEAINEAQFGKAAKHPALGAADYKMAVHLDSGRSVYTFCMCPGGEVVCATSEPEAVVVNGMSCFARDSRNANSAVLVNVEPSDFGSDHPLAGLEFQRKIEQAAYREACNAGGAPYQAPAQHLGDYLKQKKTIGRPDSWGEQVVQPSYARGVVGSDLRKCFPPFIGDALAEAFPLFDRKLRGFADENAVLTGVETRSSSPVRIRRDENFCALLRNEQTETTKDKPFGAQRVGIFPCGEGSGYAGGIMSAAVDGLRVAESLAKFYQKEANS